MYPLLNINYYNYQIEYNLNNHFQILFDNCFIDFFTKQNNIMKIAEITKTINSSYNFYILNIVLNRSLKKLEISHRK